jgi:CRISPR-associated protein Csx14
VSELCVRMDPLNPGQFFACCGLWELISLDKSGTLARFELEPQLPRVAKFIVDNSLDLRELLGRLRSAQPEFPDGHIEAKVRPAVIPYNGTRMVLDWWLNEFRDKATKLKCWAGQVTTENLFSELLPLLDEDCSGEDLFERPHMTKSKFGVDPRSAWNPRDFGFSPDKHKRDVATFPGVEILAAIGLQGFRPNAQDRNTVAFCIWQAPISVSVARLAFHAPWNGLPHRRYAFSLYPRGSYKYFTFARPQERRNTDR